MEAQAPVFGVVPPNIGYYKHLGSEGADGESVHLSQSHALDLK